MTEDEMVGWHHRLNGHEFEQALEMAKDRETWCAAVWGHKDLDRTERLNNKTIAKALKLVPLLQH